jgi:hypothetical protein
MEKTPMDCTGEAPKEWSENPEDDSLEKDDDRIESDFDDNSYEKGNGSQEDEFQNKLQPVRYAFMTKLYSMISLYMSKINVCLLRLF